MATEKNTKTVTLSDGKVVTIRRPKGRDLIKAKEIAGEDNKIKFGYALLAQVILIDGEPVVMEDVAGLWADDLDLLSREAQEGFLSSTTKSSPSSSSGDSHSLN
jgi:hypothetical protein